MTERQRAGWREDDLGRLIRNIEFLFFGSYNRDRTLYPGDGPPRCNPGSAASAEGIIAFQLPAYPPDLNSRRGIQSLTKCDIGNLAATDLAEIAPGGEAPTEEAARGRCRTVLSQHAVLAEGFPCPLL